MIQSLDRFIDDLVEGKEIYYHPTSQISVSPALALPQELEPCHLIRFDGNPSRCKNLLKIYLEEFIWSGCLSITPEWLDYRVY